MCLETSCILRAQSILLINIYVHSILLEASPPAVPPLARPMSLLSCFNKHHQTRRLPKLRALGRFRPVKLPHRQNRGSPAACLPYPQSRHSTHSTHSTHSIGFEVVNSSQAGQGDGVGKEEAPMMCTSTQ